MNFTFSIGVYRINCFRLMLELLTPLIQDQTLSLQDRLGIQTDVYALAQFWSY